MRKNYIKAGRNIPKNSFQLFLLLCVLFSSLLSAQVYIGKNTRVFIAENTTVKNLQESETPESGKIYITKGATVTGLENAANAEITYIESPKPEKAKIQLAKSTPEKEKPVEKATVEKPLSKPEKTISENNSHKTVLLFSSLSKNAVASTTTQQMKLFGALNQTEIVIPFFSGKDKTANNYHQTTTVVIHTTNKVRPPPASV